MGFHVMTDTPIIWAFIKSPNLGNVFMYDQIWIWVAARKRLSIFNHFRSVSCRKNGTANLEGVIFSTWTKNSREYYLSNSVLFIKQLSKLR